MDNVTKLFKTSAFGFNRSDVINYIEKTRNDFYDYKVQTERTISDLNDKIKELEEALAAKDNTASDDKITDGIDFSSSVSQINEAAYHLRETADKICDDIGDFLDKILSSDKEIINSVDNEVSNEEKITSETNNCTDENDSDGFMSQFSQIINNAFVEKEASDTTETKNKSASSSILDGLLGSSVFSE